MINVVSWNIGKQKAPWRELVRMAGDGDADVALVQEAGSLPGDVVDLVDYDDHVFWDRHLYDRWPLVVKLSDRITVTSYRHVPPISDLGADTIGVSGIGTIAAAKVTPRDSEHEAFIVVSMYARWLAAFVDQEPLEGRLLGCLGTSDHFGPVRLEFPILSLNPGLRHRCVAPGVWPPGATDAVRVQGTHLIPLSPGASTAITELQFGGAPEAAPPPPSGHGRAGTNVGAARLGTP